MNKGRIVDNVVQRSPSANLIEIFDNELETDCLNKGRIVDNVVQRSPGATMIVCRNDLEKPRFPESGLVPDVIEFRDPDSINPKRIQLSESNNKLNLISSSNFSETELKSVKILKIENKYKDFSEPEPKLKNSFELFPQLGRVKVVKHNLGIIYF